MSEKHTAFFETVRQRVMNGASINAPGHDTTSVFYEYLDTYYQLHFSANEAGDDDIPFPNELTRPLEERGPELLNQLLWFVDNGADFDAGGEWRPLDLAAGNADAFMTEFLILHGADPIRPVSDEKAFSDVRNRYVEHLDTLMMYESFSTAPDAVCLDAILHTVAVLARHGATFEDGFCLKIDRESRTVEANQARTLF